MVSSSKAYRPKVYRPRYFFWWDVIPERVQLENQDANVILWHGSWRPSSILGFKVDPLGWWSFFVALVARGFCFPKTGCSLFPSRIHRLFAI